MNFKTFNLKQPVFIALFSLTLGQAFAADQKGPDENIGDAFLDIDYLQDGESWMEVRQVAAVVAAKPSRWPSFSFGRKNKELPKQALGQAAKRSYANEQPAAGAVELPAPVVANIPPVALQPVAAVIVPVAAAPVPVVAPVLAAVIAPIVLPMPPAPPVQVAPKVLSKEEQERAAQVATLERCGFAPVTDELINLALHLQKVLDQRPMFEILFRVRFVTAQNLAEVGYANFDGRTFEVASYLNDSLRIPKFTDTQIRLGLLFNPDPYGFYNFSQRDLRVAERLDALKLNEEEIKRDLRLGRKVMDLIGDDFTLEHLRMGKELDDHRNFYNERYSFSKDQLQAGVQLRRLNLLSWQRGYVDRVDLFKAAAATIAVMGRLDFTEEQVNFMSRMHGMWYFPETLEDFTVAQDLFRKGFYPWNYSCLKQDAIAAAVHLKKLVYENVTKSQIETAAFLQSWKMPNLTPRDLVVGESLRSLRLDSSRDALELGNKILEALGQDIFTREQYDAAVRLTKKIKVPLSKENLLAGTRLMEIGWKTFNKAALELAVQIRSFEGFANFTEDQLKIADEIKSSWWLSKDNFLVGLALVKFDREQFFKNARSRGALRYYLNSADIVIRHGLPLSQTLLNAASYLDYNRLDGSKTNLLLAERMLKEKLGVYTEKEDLAIAQKIYAVTQSMGFGYWEWQAVKKLKKIGIWKDISKEQLEIGEELALRSIDFTIENFQAAEYWVSKYKNMNFRSNDLDSIRSEYKLMTQRKAWQEFGAGREIERMFMVVDDMFADEAYRESNKLPAVKKEQGELKQNLRQLISDRHIAFVPARYASDLSTTRELFPKTVDYVTKAQALVQYRMIFGSIEQAIDFYNFRKEYGHNVREEFNLSDNHLVSLYRALKGIFAEEDFVGAKWTLFSILENSSPKDHRDWTKATSGRADFSDFVKNVVGSVLKHVKATVSANYLKAIAQHLGPSLEDEKGVDELAGFNEAVRSFLEEVLLKDAYQGRIVEAITRYTNANFAYQQRQFEQHGHKNPLDFEPANFRSLSERLQDGIVAMDRAARDRDDLHERINRAHVCSDPFLVALREPDAELERILKGFHTVGEEVLRLRQEIEGRLRGENWIDDRTRNGFESSFGARGYGLAAISDDKHKNAVARLWRIYNSIPDKHLAASILFQFGSANHDRCIDGKRERIGELERKYVYVVGNTGVNDDFEAILGMTFAKLFADHRSEQLNKVIEDSFYEGEGRTYARIKSRRALALSFGLLSSYDDNAYYQGVQQGVNPDDFIAAYFAGGIVKIRGGAYLESPTPMAAFSVETMVNLVLAEIAKSAEQSLFAEDVLDHMLNSDSAIRRAYDEYKKAQGAPDFENAFFRASATLRTSLKPEAIKRMLNRYAYIYLRDEQGIWR